MRWIFHYVPGTSVCFFVLITVGLIAIGASPAQADLYAHWPLDEGAGDTARDLGPRGANGVIFDAYVGGLGPGGSVWVEDPDRGTVLGLAGTTAWVAAGELPEMHLDTNFSWAFWARQPPEQASPANEIILGNRWAEGGQDDTSPREFIKFTPDRFEYHMNSSGSAGDLQYDDVTRWVHRSVVKAGDTLTYYENGEERSSGAITTEQLSEDPFPFFLGGQDNRETWSGFLSDVQLYESALTESQVTSVMQGAVIGNASLYGHWKLNDGGDADTAADSGPRNEDGDIFNADTGGLGPNGSVWVDDPQRGTVLGVAGSAYVAAGELPVMDFDNDFTWNFWQKQDTSHSGDNDIIVGNRWGADGSDTAPREFIKFTPSRFEYHMNGAGTDNVDYNSLVVESDNNIPSNDEWLHHVVVKEGDRLTYYRDGTVRSSRRIGDDFTSPDAEGFPFNMGGQEGGETWQGYLSDVRLYDHPLSDAEVAELAGVGGLIGDYNGNGVYDTDDLDLQAAAILAGDGSLDLTGDGITNFDDRQFWVETLNGTWIGDSDLNGRFDPDDLLLTFSAGKYATDEFATWAEGDFDGDQRFTPDDLLAAFVDGGYAAGPRVAAESVPEPQSIALLMMGVMIGLRWRRAA